MFSEMATQATQRKAYAARSQASNVLDGNQQVSILLCRIFDLHVKTGRILEPKFRLFSFIERG